MLIFGSNESIPVTRNGKPSKVQGREIYFPQGWESDQRVQMRLIEPGDDGLGEGKPWDWAGLGEE